MKKLMLVLLVCVVIETGKEIFHAGSLIISEVSNYAMIYYKHKGLIHSDKQIVFNILFLSDECDCP